MADYAVNSNIQISIGPFMDLVQSVTGGAGTNMDGTLPSGAITTLNGQLIFAPDVHQGLIDLVTFGIRNPLRIDRVMLVMAGQSTFNVNLIVNGTAINLATGTAATTYTGEGLGFIMPGQQLQIVTTGASTTSVYSVVSLSNPNGYVIKT